VTDGQGRPDRAFRVVAERGGGAEDADDCVADELLDEAAEGLDLAPDRVEVRTQERLDVLRVEMLGPRREADQVDEDDADEAPLLPAAAFGLERDPASQAEPRDGGVLLTARRAGRYRVCGKPRSTLLVAGSGQREVTTLPRV
jgi:hypothetical protein